MFGKCFKRSILAFLVGLPRQANMRFLTAWQGQTLFIGLFPPAFQKLLKYTPWHLRRNDHLEEWILSADKTDTENSDTRFTLKLSQKESLCSAWRDDAGNATAKRGVLLCRPVSPLVRGRTWLRQIHKDWAIRAVVAVAVDRPRCSRRFCTISLQFGDLRFQSRQPWERRQSP